MYMETDVFPLSLPAHLIFVIIGTLIMGYRFYKYRKIYQLLFAIAIFASLAARLSVFWGSNFYNTVGVFEIILTVAAIVALIVSGIKNRSKAKTEN